VPFELVHHLVVVRARVNGEEAPFVLDSGIGITLLGSTLARRAGVAASGDEFSGRRMSGQEVALPLGEAVTIELGPFRREHATVGIRDLDGLPAELEGLGGFLSLDVFAGGVLTVDYARRELRAEPAEGIEVPLELHRDGPSLDAYLELALPSGRQVRVEVDMGSDVLILDERLAGDVGIDLEDPSLDRREGTDETGHRYLRTFGVASGAIQPVGAPALAQSDPPVMLQSIVHDGLVGHGFLGRFAAVTWDLAASRLVVATVAPAYDDVADAYSRALDPDGVDPVLAELVGDVAGTSVLSLGCGQGRDARLLARLGAARVTGVDISDEMLAHARRREAEEPLGIAYVRGDAQDLAPFPDASFDAVVCHMALMDIPRLRPAIASVARVLGPGGRFVFSIVHPCYAGHVAVVTDYLLDHRYDKRVPVEWLPPYAHHRPLGTYVEELTRAAFRIERVVEVHHQAADKGGVPGLLYARVVKA
jgi:ubiquinone/menaquinone biosynthesis C-methylase UbiE